MEFLVDYDYAPFWPDAPTDVYELQIEDRPFGRRAWDGTWKEVEMAEVKGLLTREELHQIVAAFTPGSRFEGGLIYK